MSVYEAIGGRETCQRLATAFYRRVEKDAVLRAIYPRSSHCAVESLTLYLSQYLGGPCEYSERRTWLSLFEAHLRFPIGQPERDAWMRSMRLAMADAGIHEPERGKLARLFEGTSTYLINRPPAAQKSTPLLPLDDAVAALRRGDIARLKEVLEHPELRRNRAGWLGLLAAMAGSGDPSIVDFALASVSAESEVAREQPGQGPTLLHGAARESSLPMVELLIGLGADPNARDHFGHTPLYCLGNAPHRDSGAAVVRALVGGGADVNAQDRIMRCTALHMAARRGNVDVALALLECGASLELADRKGVTSLGRAINCRRPEVAALLQSWAAK